MTTSWTTCDCVQVSNKSPPTDSEHCYTYCG